MEHNSDVILAEVRKMIEDIIGQDVDSHDNPISLETSFSRDLEMESIEFVVLSEKLQSSFGQNLDLPSWLAGKDLTEIIELKVGDIVGYIEQCHS